MTNYRPCIVIPNFNHSQGFEALVERVLELGIPVVVVNDGSNEQTKALIENLAASHREVSCIHLPENRGKGAAVIVGFQHAWDQHFTHVLQLDADGQHDIDDIPHFLAQSRARPEAVINGCPLYDDSAPNVRKYGRYLTHFWVWVETLSFAIGDSMCGFRVYPLHSTIPLLAEEPPGKRMDFDTEIIVRLYWRGLEIVNSPTRVVYPEGGLSNFRLWQDNLLITRMHVKLVFGMLKRLPRLLSRRFVRSEHGHWATIRERGSLLGMKLLLLIYRYLGRAPFLLVLHPVILYFSLFAGSARKASRQYLKQLASFRGDRKTPGWKQCHAHFYAFGVAAMDKIACWMGDIQRSDVVVHNPDTFEQVLASGKGAVFFGSHLGNLEVCRALGEKSGRFRINALVFNRHALKFQKILSQSNPDVELNLIHVEQMGMDTAIILKQKIEAGEIVIIVGDRTPVASIGRVRYANFLGKPAPFSEGPFVLASVLDCPVYLLFCMKQQGDYNIYLEHFADSLRFHRNEREEMMQEKIQCYAGRLEHYCLKAPLQWFNFFDFWHEDNAGGAIEALQRLKDYHE